MESQFLFCHFRHVILLYSLLKGWKPTRLGREEREREMKEEAKEEMGPEGRGQEKRKVKALN